MVRLLFNRKNKTLRAVLNTRAVLGMLEENFKTHCSLKSVVSSARMDHTPYLQHSLCLHRSRGSLSLTRCPTCARL